MTLEERFWSKVEKSDGCWEWTGSADQHGYGRIAVSRSKPRIATRVAWEITRGPIPPGMDVCHSCDNPPCVRPDHLFLGTRRDNMHDAHLKGRTAKGEAHGRHRLTEPEVVAIREKYAHGNVTMDELAGAFGVSTPSIFLIVRGKRWTHAGGPIIGPQIGRRVRRGVKS